MGTTLTLHKTAVEVRSLVEELVKDDIRVQMEAPVVLDFHSTVTDLLFNDLPDGFVYGLVDGYTTLSYLNMRYIIEGEKCDMSIVLMPGRLGRDKLFKDYLNCSFSFLSKKTSNMLGGVKVFEGDLPTFRGTFYHLVDQMKGV